MGAIAGSTSFMIEAQNYATEMKKGVSELKIFFFSFKFLRSSILSGILSKFHVSSSHLARDMIIYIETT